MAIEVRGLAPLLEVFDMPTSIAFYRDGLGFEVAGSEGKPEPNFDWVLLELNGVQLMLNTAYEAGKRPPEPSKARVAAHRDTCIYFGCPDVDAAYAHMRAKGMQVNPPHVEYYGMKQLYVLDPDGYNLCFQWPAGKEG